MIIQKIKDVFTDKKPGLSTVNDVLGTFKRTLAELEAVEAQHSQASRTKNEQAAQLANEAAEAEKEATQAAAVKRKISNLLDAD